MIYENILPRGCTLLRRRCENHPWPVRTSSDRGKEGGECESSTNLAVSILYVGIIELLYRGFRFLLS